MSGDAGTAERGEATGRILAIDYGRRRIGLAVSDPTRTLASPHSVVPNEDPPADPPEQLLRVIREIAPARIVVGIPLDMEGEEGEMAREAREFRRSLSERCQVPVVEWDERLTSALAAQVLMDSEPRRSRRRRKGRLDETAAAVLLRGYLASSALDGSMEGDETA